MTTTETKTQMKELKKLYPHYLGIATSKLLQTLLCGFELSLELSYQPINSANSNNIFLFKKDINNY